MNQFIQDDEDDAITYSVRIAVEQSILNLADAYGQKTIDALFKTSTELLNLGIQQRDAGARNWWKIHEACLLALGRFPSALSEASFDLSPLFNFALDDMSHSGITRN